MANQNQKRRSRKRRAAAAGTKPRAVPSQRREIRAERREQPQSAVKRAERVTFGTGVGGAKAYGERPANPFGGVPVAEIAILAGLVTVVVWWAAGLGVGALITGVVVMALGVVEFTAREHFSGYRSHTTLLAAVPAVVVAWALVAISGEHSGNAPLLFSAVPVFLLLFFPLRHRFQIARQARVARPAAPPGPGASST